MKRRQFGLLTGSSVAAAAALRPAQAQAAPPDASLLTTTLTPTGAERAGNADGSIPAWTGGLVSAPLPSDQIIDVPLFADEQPLYEVDASNMAQYAAMLSQGTQTLMTKFGFKIKVYQTHRTAAQPQYVYDNIAKNVTTAQLEPAGGRLGFTGGYGGTPFPIIDTTADPLISGAQIIWNHLVAWAGYSYWDNFSTAYVVTGGNVVLTFGGFERFLYPYFDPNGSLDSYQGIYGQVHQFATAPSELNGQEYLIWHSSNTLVRTDIVWELLNGQGRVRKAPDESFDTPNSQSNGINNLDDATGFYGSPQKYDWKLIGKQEILVPYNCNAMRQANSADVIQGGFPNPDYVRWEKHRMWVVEATLHPGERNTTARRTMYMDEDNWNVIFSDCYDANNELVKTITVQLYCVPSAPGHMFEGFTTWNLMTGDWAWVGGVKYPPHMDEEYIGNMPASMFDAEQMAASAAF